MLTPKSFSNEVITRNGRMGSDACEIMAAAIHAVDPYESVKAHLSVDGNTIRIGNESLALSSFNRIFLIGFGKAAVPMAKAVIDQLGDHLSLALVDTKSESFTEDNGYGGKLKDPDWGTSCANRKIHCLHANHS